MASDTGTQFAYLSGPERVLAAADLHMSGCDAPTVFECQECLRKITKYRKYLTALAAAGLLLPAGGVTDTLYRCYDLVSGGAFQTFSLKAVEDHCRAARSHDQDPLSPPPHPKQHQQAARTTWPNGSVLTGPWLPASPDQPTDTEQP